MAESAFQLTIGESVRFSKTITETDLAMFCAISGDFDPIHVDETYARSSVFGQRIAHGILSMAMLSTVAAKISQRAKERGGTATSVSMGYDKIRFLKPVFLGDTLTANYKIERFDLAKSRSISRVEILNQKDQQCVVGIHLMKWLD